MPAAPLIPLAAALAVLLLAAWAEAWHSRRIRLAERLAFGPAGVRRWTLWAPWLRTSSLAGFTWGLSTLALMESGAPDPLRTPPDQHATRVVFLADLSPSMLLADAGPGGTQTRQDRTRDVVDGILQRISGDLRFCVIAFYTDALPVVTEAKDPELVRNVFHGLPLSYAMPAGKTDLGKAVNAALDLVAAFPPGSTRLLVLTDGDATALEPVRARPESVAEVLVLGTGHPEKGTYIDGHQSRQETATLQRLAGSLRGSYYNVNTKHLPTAALGDLVKPLPPLRKGWNLAQAAVFAMVLGASILALLPVTLEYCGSAWKLKNVDRPSPTPAA